MFAICCSVSTRQKNSSKTPSSFFTKPRFIKKWPLQKPWKKMLKTCLSTVNPGTLKRTKGNPLHPKPEKKNIPTVPTGRYTSISDSIRPKQKSSCFFVSRIQGKKRAKRRIFFLVDQNQKKSGIQETGPTRKEKKYLEPQTASHV